MKSHALTLIELLVAIAILLALAAILMPVTHLVKNRSLISACAGNLKQIGKALLMYADDYQGRLPCYALSTRIAGIPDERGRAEMAVRLVSRPKEWRDSLATYTKSHEVFWCPADWRRGQPVRGNLDHPEDRAYLYTSYRISMLSQWHTFWGPNGTLAIRLANLPKPASEMPYLEDVEWERDILVDPERKSWTYHGERALNGLFLDGHVKFVRLPQRCDQE